MNDYTTKTVRVCVNNEEVVVTTTTSIGGGGGGGRNNLDEENNNGVDNMLSMEEYYKQDHNIEGELLRIREEGCVCVCFWKRFGLLFGRVLFHFFSSFLAF